MLFRSCPMLSYPIFSFPFLFLLFPSFPFLFLLFPFFSSPFPSFLLLFPSLPFPSLPDLSFPFLSLSFPHHLFFPSLLSSPFYFLFLQWREYDDAKITVIDEAYAISATKSVNSIILFNGTSNSQFSVL